MVRGSYGIPLHGISLRTHLVIVHAICYDLKNNSVNSIPIVIRRWRLIVSNRNLVLWDIDFISIVMVTPNGARCPNRKVITNCNSMQAKSPVRALWRTLTTWYGPKTWEYQLVPCIHDTIGLRWDHSVPWVVYVEN